MENYNKYAVQPLAKYIILAICLMIVGGVLFFSIKTAAPDFGEALVLIKKPYFFGHGGVDPEPVTSGRVYLARSTEYADVSLQPQAVDLELKDFMTKDGVPMDFHTQIRIQVTDPVVLVTKYGAQNAGWFTDNVTAAYAKIVRSAVKSHGMQEVAIETSAIDAIDAEVTTNLEAYIKDIGIPIKLLTVNVGKANPPDAILDQRVETARQEQRVKTEQQRKLAEDSRLAAEQSRASADNAYRDAMHLSPDQFVRLEQVKMQRDVCNQKDSHCTFIVGTSVSPVVNADK